MILKKQNFHQTVAQMNQKLIKFHCNKIVKK